MPIPERYGYTAFGQGTVMDASFNAKTPDKSAYDWQVRIHGKLRDEESGYYNF